MNILLAELRNFRLALASKTPKLRSIPNSTICRALNFDFKLTRKNLMKVTSKFIPEEIKNYYEKIRVI